MNFFIIDPPLSCFQTIETQKKEAHSEEVPIPAFTTTLQKTHIEMCRANTHGHTDSKSFLQSSICEVVIQEWTFTISLPIFIQLYFCCQILLFLFRKFTELCKQDTTILKKNQVFFRFFGKNVCGATVFRGVFYFCGIYRHFV